MIHFLWIWILLLLPVPWLVQRFLPAAATQEAALYAPFATEIPIAATPQHTQRIVSRWQHLLPWLIWCLLLLAAARPQWLGDTITLPATGRNLMLAIDVSGSMKTPDLDTEGNQSTRLDVIKQVAGQFLDRRSGDRLGLILFGTHAYLQTPLTFDHITAHHFLDEAVIGIAGPQTAIGDAIGLAIKRLRKAPGKKAVLILLTDGQNTAGILPPREAAHLAVQAHLRIYTIGIGADRMRIPGLFGSQIVNPSADLDEAMLKAVAKQTGGQYFRARNRRDLEAIYQRLNTLEAIAGKGRELRPVTALYPWPLGISLILSFIQAGLFTVWNRP